MSILQYRSSELMATRKLASDIKNDTDSLTFAPAKPSYIQARAYKGVREYMDRRNLANELLEVWEL